MWPSDCTVDSSKSGARMSPRIFSGDVISLIGQINFDFQAKGEVRV